MAEFVEVAKEDEVDPGTAGVFEVNGVEIALVNTGGEFYAVQNDCPHAGGPLGEGDLVEDYIIECPLHGSCFDVRSGECTKGPGDEPLYTYEVVVEDGVVKVAVE